MDVAAGLAIATAAFGAGKAAYCSLAVLCNPMLHMRSMPVFVRSLGRKVGCGSRGLAEHIRHYGVG